MDKIEIIRNKSERLALKVESIKAEIEQAKGREISRLPELKQDLSIAVDQLQRQEIVMQMASNFDKLKFIKEATPAKLYTAYMSVNDSKKAIELKKIRLSELDFSLGEGTSVDWLNLFIFDLIEKTGVPKMEFSDVEFLAFEIYSQNKHLSTPEIVLVFRRIATGFYGSLFNKVNALSVCPMFAEYRKERLSALDQIEKERNPPSSMASDLQNFGKEAFSRLPEGPFLRQYAELGRTKEARKLFKDKIKAPEDSDEIKAIKNQMHALLLAMSTADKETAEILQDRYNLLAEKIK